MYQWIADGDANFFRIVDEGRWIAVVRLNGELTNTQQESMMQKMTDALNASREN